jgi:hypothetical protein
VNGKVISGRGMRPAWIYGAMPGPGFNLTSRANPDLTISIMGGNATLLHGGHYAGYGACAILPTLEDAARFRDQHY